MKEDTEIELDSNFNFTGNCSPKDITFGDITVNDNITYGGSLIQLLLDNGATATVEVDGLGEVDAMFTYATADVGAPTDGWYLMDDYGFEYCQNDRVLAAGKGILVDVSDSGAAITIPAAL